MRAGTLAGYVHEVTDGVDITVRPVRPGDADALRAAFERLSPESRRSRFHAPKRRLTDAEVRYLTDVDHRDHEALVALAGDDADAIVGVARYVRLADEPSAAEAAIVVGDEWQGRGIATTLLEALRERARSEGIDTFVADVLAENERRIEALFEHIGEQRAGDGREPLRLRFALDQPRDRAPDPRVGLRAAASGTFRLVSRVMRAFTG